MPTRNVSTLAHDDKVMGGALHEKDAQIGASEEICIDPVAEKKVTMLLNQSFDTTDAVLAHSKARSHAFSYDGLDLFSRLS